MGKCCLHASSFIFDRIIIKVASNQGRHKSSDEFDFGLDQTTHFGVTCSWMTKFYTFRTWIYLRPVGQSWSNFMCSITGGGERVCYVLRQIGSKLCPYSGVHGNRKPPLTYNGENGVSTFSRLLLIRSFLYLQVTRICIKSRTSSNFGQIGPLTTELTALERLKKFPHRLIMGKWCLHASSFIFDRIIIKVAGNQDRYNSLVEFDLGRIRPLILELLALEWRTFHTFELEDLWSQLANLDQILCIASLGWGKGCIRFWGRFDQSTGFLGNRKPPFTDNGENNVHLFSVVFDPILFKLAGHEDMHKISDEFKFRPDRITDYGVSCPWGLKISHRLIVGKWCLHASSSIFDRITSKLLVTRTGIKVRTFRFRDSAFHGPFICFLKWDLTLAYWTQVSDRCPLGYLSISLRRLFLDIWNGKRGNWYIRTVYNYIIDLIDILWCHQLHHIISPVGWSQGLARKKKKSCINKRSDRSVTWGNRVHKPRVAIPTDRKWLFSRK